MKKNKKVNEKIRLCNMPITLEPKFDANIGSERSALIIVNKKKWVNGTKLTYYLYSKSREGRIGGTSKERKAVKEGLKMWQDVGIGIIFEEVKNPEDSILRIGFERGAGSWSYLGRDNWERSKDERTMNFGWDISKVDGMDTILHEIGHALGFPHEHQNPNAGIVWNQDNVINELSGPPNNWDLPKIKHNVLNAKRSDAVKGSEIDENSIMIYPIPSSWIDSPEHLQDGIDPKAGLSKTDKEWVRKFYPKSEVDDFTTLELFTSESFNIQPGQQQNFCFLAPRTRTYEIRTFGNLDTIMVLFEKGENNEIYLSADDDSGTDYNSSIKLKLVRNREYLIRVRLYSKSSTGNTSIMVF